MASWENIEASISLRDELDVAFPNRSKVSDGTVAGQQHLKDAPFSDHNPDESHRTPYEDADSINEVHARDVTSKLNRPGWTMFRVFEIIRVRAEAGLETRVQNMICDGKITSRTWGFRNWRPYGGKDPHDTHGHLSFRYGSGDGQNNPENITAPWGILAAVQLEIREREEKALLPKLNEILEAIRNAHLGVQQTAQSVLTLRKQEQDRAVVLAELRDELLTPPAELPDPESHPLVQAVRYALTHPPVASSEQ